jgi:EAL domain-containing protein (putative c-di-GMP-specific phosphodiesterase class I)/DNA-binding NarL/FixJ family response regulator
MTTAMTYPLAMVIDDEAFMRKLIATQLRSLGCRSVLCHESGKDALAALSEQLEKVSLILCDLQMPDMDGIEVVRQLGLMAYPGALVLVSGEDSLTMSMAQKLASAHGLNVLGTMRKPVQPDQLKKLLMDVGSAVARPMPPKVQPMLTVEDLADAIRQGQLLNHYQPKVSTRSGRVVGVEALVRWQHPRLGLIYPEAFIPLAEHHGLIGELTNAVLGGPEGALMHLKHWLGLGLSLHVAVNVSMDSLYDLNFPNVVAQLAADVGVPLSHVALEVTESRLNADMRSVIDVLTRLRLKRLRLSIDDFGTGYSSLAQLHELPFDELKVDRRFVHEAHLDHALDSILEASINIGSDLGMETTGEGVETVEDWLHLQRKGCDVAQGFWIARPMPASKVADWIDQWNAGADELPGLSHQKTEGGNAGVAP